MAKRKTSAQSAWHALVRTKTKQYGGKRGMQMAAAEWRKRKGGASRNSTKARKSARKNPAPVSNPYFRYKVPAGVMANPYFKYSPGTSAYNPYVHAHKRKTSKGKKAHVKGHYRKAKKNPPARYKVPAGVVANPVFENDFFSKTGATSRTAAPMGASVEQAKGFFAKFVTKEFLFDHFAPLTVGFLGTKLLIGALSRSQEVKPTDSPERAKVLNDRLVLLNKYRSPLLMASGVALGLGVGMVFKSTDWAVRVTTGGIFAGLLSILERQEFYTTWMSLPPLEGLNGLGAISTSAKDKIAKLVEQEVAREAASMSGLGRGMGAYVTEGDIRQQESFQGMDAYVTDQELRARETGPGARSGVSMDEFLAGPDMGL